MLLFFTKLEQDARVLERTVMAATRNSKTSLGYCRKISSTKSGNEVVEDSEDSSTHNRELAVDVLIDSAPAAGAEGFVENIAKSRETGYRYLTKRCIQAQPLALDAERLLLS